MSIEVIKYYQSACLNPYLNLSFEEKLMELCSDGELIFYLWQNKDTVVIGKNQCAQYQCYLDRMEKDNITLARRSSGGGAVYHDTGNLNFTFITKTIDFDTKKNLQVIVEALKDFGIDAVFSGRNDLLVDQYKISGQAYWKTKMVSLHHGTLLVDVDLNNLLKYLKTDINKLKKHGVQSHAQRVKNISDFNSTATVPAIMDSLKKAVTRVFKCPCVECEITTHDLTDKYSSEHWLSRFDLTGKRISRRFDYGLLDIHLQVFNGTIKDVQINSDLMDVELIDQIKDNLRNKKYNHALPGLIRLNNKVVQADVIKMIADDLSYGSD